MKRSSPRSGFAKKIVCRVLANVGGTCRILYFLIITLACCPAANAQATEGAPIRFALGIRGGVELLSALVPQPTYGQASWGRFTGGPVFEAVLRSGTAFELAPLREHVQYSEGIDIEVPGSGQFQTISFSATAHSWEFPFVVKQYIAKKGVIHPYPEAGFSLRQTSGNIQTVLSGVLCSSCGPTTTLVNPTQAIKSFAAGFILGGGVDFGLGPIHFGPEFRYVHWGDQPITAPITLPENTSSNKNDAGFFVRVVYRR